MNNFKNYLKEHLNNEDYKLEYVLFCQKNFFSVYCYYLQNCTIYFAIKLLNKMFLLRTQNAFNSDTIGEML